MGLSVGGDRGPEARAALRSRANRHFLFCAVLVLVFSFSFLFLLLFEIYCVNIIFSIFGLVCAGAECRQYWFFLGCIFMLIDTRIQYPLDVHTCMYNMHAFACMYNMHACAYMLYIHAYARLCMYVLMTNDITRFISHHHIHVTSSHPSDINRFITCMHDYVLMTNVCTHARMHPFCVCVCGCVYTHTRKHD